MLTSKKSSGLTSSLSVTRDNKGSLSALRIVRSAHSNVEYTFPKPKTVPAGKYRSKITDIIESVTKQGDNAIDVHYDITNGTNTYRIKMRYPLDSTHFCALCDALLDAGVPEKSNIKKAVNVEEMIELGYPNGATIGTIISRTPVIAPAVPVDDDDEYDILLDDDDLSDD